MLLRNGCTLRKKGRWFLDEMKLRCFTYYKYLAIMASSHLSWGMATKTLASQANKMLIMTPIIIKILCGNIPFDIIIYNFFYCILLEVMYYYIEVCNKRYFIIYYLES